MGKSPVTYLLLAAALLPAPAAAGAGCGGMYPRGNPVIRDPASFRPASFRIVKLQTNGRVFYAGGPLQEHRQPGLDPRVTGWSSASPAVEIFADAPPPPASSNIVFRNPVKSTLRISLEQGARVDATTVQLRFGIPGTTAFTGPVTFRASCSSSGILRGMSGDSEYLIYVDIPT